jgi:hypothetical protein
VQELFLVRRAAGKVLFNVAASRPAADLHAAYRATMDRAYGLPGTVQDEARLTLDEESTLGAADYLRGWLLGAQIRSMLVKKLGARWWEDPKAGDLLKPLLAPGNGLDPDGLARLLGEPGVSVDAFLAAIVPRLSGAGAEGQSPAPAAPASPATGSSSGPAPATNGSAAVVAPVVSPPPAPAVLRGTSPDAGTSNATGSW